MDDKDRQSAFMQALVTEHFVLQSAASTTVSESGVRASLYVFSVSSALVAMGFTSQAPGVFAPLVATVLPALFVLGWFTVVRLVDTGVENIQFLRAIARIRRHYRSLTPEAERFFAPWGAADDELEEAMAMLAARSDSLTAFFTTASMVATINSLVGGVGVALLGVALLGDDLAGVGIALGVVAGLAFIAVAYVYQRRRYDASAAAERRRSAVPQDRGS
jgi:hypothetical protein